MDTKNTDQSYTHVVVPHKFDIKRILLLAALTGFLGSVCMVIYTYAFPEKTALQICQESYMKSVNEIYRENEATAKKCAEEYKSDIFKLNKCTSSPLPIPANKCWNELNATGGIAPVPPRSPTLREKFWLKDCRFVNEFHRLWKYNLEWTAYDIACEKWIAFDVRSPWEFHIEKKWYWANIGNYVILKNNSDFRIVLWHLQTSRKVWEKLKEWDIIWQTNLSWQSTGMHVHIELWWKYYILSSPVIYWWEHYREFQWALLAHRKWDFWQPKEQPYYFTHYDLWVVAQNDASPCHWATWEDLCELSSKGINTMALTKDIREKLWVNFGDKVKLTAEKGCEWEYLVKDEMNCRFRWKPCWYKKKWEWKFHPTWNVLREWTPYYIKWDLPNKAGWACFVTKI